jgi:hypothetical protein
MGWRDDRIIPNQKSRVTPALAEHGGLLHMVHLGDSSNDIWYATFDGNDWTDDVRILNQKSWVGPALAGFEGGRLHMVHLGDSSHTIWHSRHDGNGWADDVRVPNQVSGSCPSITEFNGLIHMLHLGDSSHDIWHATFDGNNWTDDVMVPNQKSFATPAICAHDGELHMVHAGSSTGDIWHSTFDGNDWAPNVRIPGQMTRGAPALAELDGRLHMIHMGWSYNDIWHSILRNDGTWSENVRLPNQETGQAPSLAAYGGFLYTAHLGTTSHTIWFSQWDPNYVYPTHQISVGTPWVEGDPQSGQVIKVRARRRSEGTDPPAGRVSLQLKRDEFGPNETLKEIVEYGVDVDAELTYVCPGQSSGDNNDSGTWEVYGKAYDEDGHESVSRNITIRDCRQADPGGGPTTSRATFRYRFEALAGPGGPKPTGSVRFTGTRTGGAGGGPGADDFDEETSGGWQHDGGPANDDYWIAGTEIFGLKPGHWRVQVIVPLFQTTCEVDFELGANPMVNFTMNVAGCDRNFTFPE